eukprot:m.111242 g.111242  ORF g.111242 m.111242 type:complete len:988 (+) comp13437_c0_seq5:1802-4765(+)
MILVCLVKRNIPHSTKCTTSGAVIPPPHVRAVFTMAAAAEREPKRTAPPRPPRPEPGTGAVNGVAKVTVWVSPQAVALSSSDREVVLVFAKQDASLSALPVQSFNKTGSFMPCGDVWGYLGMAHLIPGPHLVLTTGISKIGTLYNEHVFRINSVELIPVSPNATGSIIADILDKKQSARAAREMASDDTQNARLHAHHLKHIRRMFSKDGASGMYFSATTGKVLLNCRTRMTLEGRDNSVLSVCKLAKDVLWNEPMLAELLAFAMEHERDEPQSEVEQEHTVQGAQATATDWPSTGVDNPIAKWLCPIFQGYFGTVSMSVFGTACTLTLISRRFRARVGCRFLCRGVDTHGNVANSVETEQIFQRGSICSSFLLYRGSIPVYWTQRPQKLAYTPAPRVERTIAENKTACKRHVEQLKDRFGSTQFWINLIQKSGREAAIGKRFEEVFSALSPAKVTYFAFDYHKQCKGDSQKIWDAVDVMHLALNDMGSTRLRLQMHKQPKLISLQDGIVRVNCMDCLDRTNVTESMIARRMLFEELVAQNVVKRHESSIPHALETACITLWTQNGNLISKQYSGTDALKTEATGNRNSRVFGALNDGRKSVNRFYLNQFQDTFRQEAIDLLQRYRTVQAILQEGTAVQSESVQELQLFVKRTVESIVPATEHSIITAPMLRQDMSVRSAYCILSLTSAALYTIYVNFSEEAVISYTRVPVSMLVRVESGTMFSKEMKQLHIPIRGRQRPAALRIQFKRQGHNLLSRLNKRGSSIWLSELFDLDGAIDYGFDSDSDSDGRDSQESYLRGLIGLPLPHLSSTKASAKQDETLAGDEDEDDGEGTDQGHDISREFAQLDESTDTWDEDGAEGVQGVGDGVHARSVEGGVSGCVESSVEGSLGVAGAESLEPQVVLRRRSKTTLLSDKELHALRVKAPTYATNAQATWCTFRPIDLTSGTATVSWEMGQVKQLIQGFQAIHQTDSSRITIAQPSRLNLLS